MRKIILVSLIFILLYAVFAIYLTPLLANKEKIKQTAEAELTELSGYRLKIDGALETKLFPYPKFIAKNAYLINQEKFSDKYFIAARNVQAAPGFLSLLLLSPKISAINAAKGEIYYETLADGQTNFIVNSKASEKLAKIPTVKILKANITVKNAQTIVANHEINNLELKQIFTPEPRVSLSGNYLQGDVAGNFLLKFSAPDHAKAELPIEGEINAGDLNVVVNGRIINWFSKPEIVGKAELHMRNFASSISTQLSTRKLPLLEKISHEEMVISGDLRSSATGLVLAGTANFSGSSGPAEITFNKTQKYPLSIKAELKGINLDQPIIATTEAPAVDKKSDGKTTASAMDSMFEFSKNYPVNLNLLFDEIVYKGKKIEKLNINSEFAGSKIFIKNLSGILPGNSQILISAIPEIKAANADEYSIQGSAKFMGDELGTLMNFLTSFGFDLPTTKLGEFYFESNFALTNQSIYLESFESFIEDALIKGQLLVNKTAEQNSYEVIINADNLDIDKFMEASQTADQQPVQNDGAVKDYLNFFDKVRAYKDNVQISLDLKNLKYLEQKFPALALQMKVLDGVISVDSLRANSEVLGNVAGDFYLDCKELRPLFKGFINIQNFEPGQFFENPITLQVADKLDYYAFKLGIAKLEENAKDSELQTGGWSIKPFNFNILSIMDIDLNLGAESFTLGRLPFKNVSAALEGKDKQIQMKNFQGNLFGGNVDIKMNLSTVGRPSAGVTYAVSNADMGEAFAALSELKDNIGKFSVSGSFSFSGVNLNSWMSQIQGNGSLVSRNGSFAGYDPGYLKANFKAPRSVADFEVMQNIAITQGFSRVDFMSANFVINDSLLELKNYNIRAQMIHDVVPKLTLHLGNWQLDSTIEFQTEVVDAFAKPVVMNLTGSPDRIEKKVDTSAIRKHWEDTVAR